jgi:hypothetical protein
MSFKLFLFVLFCGVCMCCAYPHELFTQTSKFADIGKGMNSTNCSSIYSCAGKGDSCNASFTKGDCMSGSSCCAQGLFCVNSECATDNMGANCTTMADCHSAIAPSYNCVNKTCQYIYGPGDTCTTSNDCIGALNCTSSVCVGIAQGQTCQYSGLCAFGLYCATNNNGSMQCMPQPGVNATCSTQNCYPGNVCEGGKCIAEFSVASGKTCSTEKSCETGLVCASNGTCVEALTSLTTCTNATTDCPSQILCLCSPFSGTSFCVEPLYDPCTDEASDLDSCIAENNCTNTYGSPNSCAYDHCYSEIKKSNSCGCSAADTIYDSCFYNEYCGGFPVWAIILIIVVAIVLVLAIVLLVFFMMRRRRQYDSI